MDIIRESLEQSDALRRQACKAALYLRSLVRAGDLDAVRVDLTNLGTLGQIVIFELVRRLTTREADKLENYLSQEITSDTPRIRQRKSLSNLAELGEAIADSAGPRRAA